MPQTPPSYPPFLQPSQPPITGTSSTPSALLNFLNCVIGAGVIGTGGAVAKSGWAVSVGTMVGVAGLTWFSLEVVVGLGEREGVSNC